MIATCYFALHSMRLLNQATREVLFGAPVRMEVDGEIVQWQKDGVDIPGAVEPVFRINHMSERDSGTYSCRVDGGEPVRITTLIGVNLPGEAA